MNKLENDLFQKYVNSGIVEDIEKFIKDCGESGVKISKIQHAQLIERIEFLEGVLKRLKHNNKGSSIYTIEVPVNDDCNEYAIGYVRSPKRNELAIVLAQLEQKPIETMEILLNTVWLEGDERIKNDDEIFFGAISTLEDLVKFRKGQLKKN